jgi:hypothetical protein
MAMVVVVVMAAMTTSPLPALLLTAGAFIAVVAITIITIATIATIVTTVTISTAKEKSPPSFKFAVCHCRVMA